MKKQILKLSLAIFTIALVFSGCKKGENDPFISLKSRTARIANTWELTSEDYKTTSVNSTYSYTDTYSYSNGIETSTETYSSGGSSQTNTYTSTYTHEISIKKDGTFTMDENNDGDLTSNEGNWIWLGKNKNMELADKEAIVFNTTKDVNGGNTDNYSGKSNPFDQELVIDKLSSKELVILFDYSYTNSDGHTYTQKGTMTYTKK